MLQLSLLTANVAGESFAAVVAAALAVVVKVVVTVVKVVNLPYRYLYLTLLL